MSHPANDIYREMLLEAFEDALKEHIKRDEENELNERERQFHEWMTQLDNDAEAIEDFLNGC